VPQANWSLSGWRKGPVTLLQAFGIKKGNVQFPSLTPVLPGQVAASTPATTSGGGKGGAAGGNAGAPSAGQAAANARLGKTMVAAAGWTGQQWEAFNNIVMAESGWETEIHNGGGFGYVPGLAYGIPQALPGSKMASAGNDWQTSPATQIKWMIGYIRAVYGSPVNAWNFHLAHGYY